MVLKIDSPAAAEKDVVLTGEEARAFLDQFFSDELDVEDDSGEIFFLTVRFPEPLDEAVCRRKFLRPLNRALQREEIGEVAGAQTAGSGCGAFEVVAYELEAGIECIQRVLRKAGAAAGTAVFLDETTQIGVYDEP